MRCKKIRGHRRRWKHIDKWISANQIPDVHYLKNHERDYVKIRVSPWGNISITNSITPQPRKKTKDKIVLGLFSIYQSWKHYLNNLDQPYYLRIWFFEPRFDKSQVVCALNNSIHFYEGTFFDPESKKTFPFHMHKNVKSEFKKYVWEYRLDEDYYDSDEIGKPEHYASLEEFEETKKWFITLLKKPHRTIQYKENSIESYAFKRGSVWIGEYKNTILSE
jgi:hypothetical protein